VSPTRLRATLDQLVHNTLPRCHLRHAAPQFATVGTTRQVLGHGHTGLPSAEMMIDVNDPSPNRGKNWTAIAAMLGGIAALLTAVVGVLTFVTTQLSGTDKNSGSAQQPGSARTTAATPAGTPVSTVTTDEAVVPTAWTQVWTGSFLFDNNGINFDHEPPLRNAGGNLQVYSGGSSAVAAGFGSGKIRLASLPGGTTATPEACSERLDNYSTGSIDLDTGKQVCVRTARGRVVLMKVDAGPDDGLGWDVTVTIWQPNS
jgi:hypothetical protein